MLSIVSSLLLAAVTTFGPPVNFPLSLAGNFGEPRPNHFHGGIDVRTQASVNKAMLAIGDGYVARITVGKYGYGKALYIRHPGGLTSVYCHLNGFVPQLEAEVRKWQYLHRQSVADVWLKPGCFPVSKGDLVAISGNTGASQTPHLHLEIHDTRTWSMLDPLRFLPHLIHDTTPPMAHAFMACPQEGKGVFNGSANRQTVGFSSHNLTRQFTAWGQVGFAIWANDYMDGSYGRLGVKSVTLMVDGRKVFESVVDSIPERDNRAINHWGDYLHYCRNNVWYIKSFTHKGINIPCVITDDNRGVINFNQERPYNIVYTLIDAFGNHSQYSFTVTGKRQALGKGANHDAFNTVSCHGFTSFQRPGMQLNLRPGLLPYNTQLKPKITMQPGKLSHLWNFSTTAFTLIGWGDISLKLNHPVRNPKKLYIVCHSGTDRYSGGHYENGWVRGRARELGATYEIAYDDIPPRIVPFGANGRHINVGITDSQSGVREWQGYIDGRFVVFEKLDKQATLRCTLKDNAVRKTGRSHSLTLVAHDMCGNKAVYKTTFVY